MDTRTKSHVNGISIYQDKHGRDVYYDRLTKDGYLILESNAPRFSFYQKRFLFPLIVFALLLNFDFGSMHVGWVEAGAVALITLLGLEYFFRFKYLKTLTVIPNFKPEKKESFLKKVNRQNEPKILLLKGFLYILFGVLLLIYAYQLNSTGFDLIIMAVISGVVIIVGLTYLYALIVRKKC